MIYTFSWLSSLPALSAGYAPFLYFQLATLPSTRTIKLITSDQSHWQKLTFSESMKYNFTCDHFYSYYLMFDVVYCSIYIHTWNVGFIINIVSYMYSALPVAEWNRVKDRITIFVLYTLMHSNTHYTNVHCLRQFSINLLKIFYLKHYLRKIERHDAPPPAMLFLQRSLFFHPPLVYYLFVLWLQCYHLK